jgi:tRNA pseudouridine38-40 synthase
MEMDFPRSRTHGSVPFVTQWKLTLSYDGTGFHGWQVQPGLLTIQGTLSSAIARVTGETLLPQGSGRTDAGVHALAQVTSFAIEVVIPPANFLRALNSVLPPSIRVIGAEHAASDFHARHCARRKTYEYRLFERRKFEHSELSDSEDTHRICPPFLAPYVWDCRWAVDFDRMQEAAARLLGGHDFASFAASDPDRAARADSPDESTLSTVRTILVSAWSRKENVFVYRVTGTGFLHHMVRNIVGTLVDVGRGSLEPSDINRILAARDRSTAGPTAPACGLFLVAVEYPRDPEAEV